MAACSDCGFPVRWAKTDEGESIPLDERADQITGNDRYYFPDPVNKPDTVALMGAGHIGYGHSDHRKTCPRVRREARL